MLLMLGYVFYITICSHRRRLLPPGGLATAVTLSSRSHREGGAYGDDYNWKSAFTQLNGDFQCL